MFTLSKIFRKIALTGLLSMQSSLLLATPSVDFMILGLISQNSSESLVLIKEKTSRKTYVIKSNEKILNRFEFKNINRKWVEVKDPITSTVLLIEVGGDGRVSIVNTKSFSQNGSRGIERHNQEVRVSKEYKDYILNEKLSEVLLQAATEAYIENGRLRGFHIWDITPGSIYEQIGLMNGDLITTIEKDEINNVGSAIKQLQMLRDRDSASIGIIRNGTPQTLQLKVVGSH